MRERKKWLKEEISSKNWRKTDESISVVLDWKGKTCRIWFIFWNITSEINNFKTLHFLLDSWVGNDLARLGGQDECHNETIETEHFGKDENENHAHK